jgi:hypothetical protein
MLLTRSCGTGVSCSVQLISHFTAAVNAAILQCHCTQQDPSPKELFQREAFLKDVPTQFHEFMNAFLGSQVSSFKFSDVI